VRKKGELGVIARGAYADALVLDIDPLKQIAALASGGKDLRAIIKEGVVYKDDNGLLAAIAQNDAHE